MFYYDCVFETTSHRKITTPFYVSETLKKILCAFNALVDSPDSVYSFILEHRERKREKKTTGKHVEFLKKIVYIYHQLVPLFRGKMISLFSDYSIDSITTTLFKDFVKKIGSIHRNMVGCLTEHENKTLIDIYLLDSNALPEVVDLVYLYSIFSLLDNPTLLARFFDEKIECTPCFSFDEAVFSVYYDNSFSSLQISNHSTQWYRLWSLRSFSQLGLFPNDVATFIMSILIELREEEYPELCLYCSGAHQTWLCKYMLDHKCYFCGEFLDFEEVPKFYNSFYGSCEKEEELCIDCKIKDELWQRYEIRTKECDLCHKDHDTIECRKSCCNSQTVPHLLKDHECVVCYELGHLEKDCGQLCSCDYGYYHSKYDCYLAQTDFYPNQNRKRIFN